MRCRAAVAACCRPARRLLLAYRHFLCRVLTLSHPAQLFGPCHHLPFLSGQSGFPLLGARSLVLLVPFPSSRKRGSPRPGSDRCRANHPSCSRRDDGIPCPALFPPSSAGQRWRPARRHWWQGCGHAPRHCQTRPSETPQGCLMPRRRPCACLCAQHRRSMDSARSHC